MAAGGSNSETLNALKICWGLHQRSLIGNSFILSFNNDFLFIESATQRAAVIFSICVIVVKHMYVIRPCHLYEYCSMSIH